MEDMYSSKTAAMSFLHELCKARAKGNLDMLMAVSGAGLSSNRGRGAGGVVMVTVVVNGAGLTQ